MSVQWSFQYAATALVYLIDKIFKNERPSIEDMSKYLTSALKVLGRGQHICNQIRRDMIKPGLNSIYKGVTDRYIRDLEDLTSNKEKNFELLLGNNVQQKAKEVSEARKLSNPRYVQGQNPQRNYHSSNVKSYHRNQGNFRRGSYHNNNNNYNRGRNPSQYYNSTQKQRKGNYANNNNNNNNNNSFNNKKKS